MDFLFNLLPGNDSVSKTINGATIAVAVAFLPFMIIPAIMTVVYCAVTGAPMWTYRA
jgi:ABC-type phosphate transport system permease subunit